MTAYTRSFAEFVAKLDLAAVPESTICAAKRCLLDSVGCAIGGSSTPAGVMVLSVVEKLQGPSLATVLGTDFKTSPIWAGFANASLANALDYDDTLVGHHGCTVIPSALALGEALRVPGKRLLEAVIVGYDVSIRCMACLQPNFARFSGGWDLGTLQTLGATAAASRILGLNAQEISDALGIALSTAPLPMIRKEKSLMGGHSDFKSGYGWSVQAGLEAALLAPEGFRAQDHCLDGELKFWSEGRNVRLGLDNLQNQLGERFLIEQVAFKPYPTCRFLHSALEALEQIVSAESLRAEDIDQIEVATFSLLTDEYHNIAHPASFTEAQFSLPFCLALLATNGKLTPRVFTASAVHDPRILELASRVRVREDEEASRQFPEHEPATVSVFVKGRRRELSAIVMDSRGNPERALSQEDIERKFRDQASIWLSSEQIDRFIEAIDNLEEWQDVSLLFSSLDL